VGHPTLNFVSSANLANPEARWLGSVLGAWPARVPICRQERLDDLVARVEKRATEWLAPDEIVLAVLGPSEPASRVDLLVETMVEHQTPGVILLQEPRDWRLTQRHGVIFERWDADPRVVAGMLYALGERQQAVRLLSREVMLAQRCQGGIRSEIDRLHEELHLAATIQRDFTSSPLPQLDGLAISVLFRPVNFVSGDVYNVRTLPDGRAAFLIADAVGHGVPAALLTMVLSSSLAIGVAEQAIAGVQSPAEVLSKLNRRLCDLCLGSGRFATAAYGVIDPRTREVTIAGAGHPLPVVVARDTFREIETAGPLLGVFEDADFDQCTFSLDDDETLLVYTDGLEASFSGPGSFSEKRASWLRKLGTAREAENPTGGMVQELLGLLDAQAGSLHQSDDVTAICMAAEPKAAMQRLAA